MKKPKIAIITNGYFPVPATKGGAVEALDENIINQNEISQKIDLTVFSIFDDKAQEISSQYHHTDVRFIDVSSIIKLGDKIVYFIAKHILRIKKNQSYRYILQRLNYIKKIAKILKKEEYDKLVIENHSSLFRILKKYNNSKKYQGKYYYHLHNVVKSDYGCKAIMQNCAGVIGVSDYINGTLKDFLGDEDKSNYFVLRNKIDRNKFNITLSADEIEYLRKQYDIGNGEKVILFTGRLNEEKGVRELLNACIKIKEENFKLLIVGGYYFASGMCSPFEEEIKNFTSQLGNKIVFTGFIDYGIVPKLYAIADIVVLPSMWDDPAPLTVIESLTAGKALITTDSGGIPEYTNDNTSVIIKRDKNIVDNLAISIKDLIHDENKRKSLEQAASSMTQDWTIEAYYEDFYELIRN